MAIIDIQEWRRSAPVSEGAVTREERLLIKNLTVSDCLFEDTTVLDQFTIQGVLPGQKAELLGAIDYLLSL